jgi:hypothetical protein
MFSVRKNVLPLSPTYSIFYSTLSHNPRKLSTTHHEEDNKKPLLDKGFLGRQRRKFTNRINLEKFNYFIPGQTTLHLFLRQIETKGQRDCMAYSSGN